MTIKRHLVGATLWAAYLLTMAASISHLAWTFNTLEPAGNTWAGWASAVAVDAGLAALAYAIQQRRRAKRSVRALWGGVVVLAAVSAYANTLHALSVAPTELVRALVLSAILPVIVVYLGEIISADDAAAADAADAAALREARRMEREQMRLEAQAERMRAADAAASLAQAAASAPQAADDAARMRSDAARIAARARWDAVRAGQANGANGANGKHAPAN